MGTTKSIVLTRSAIILNFSATIVVALNTVYKRRKELEEATTPGGSKLFAGLAIALTLFGFVLALWATFSIAGDVGSGGREGEG